MKNLNDGLKVLIITCIALAVLAAAGAALYFTLSADVTYTTVDESYNPTEPLDLTAALTVTPAPTATPAPTPTPEAEPEEPQPDEHGFYPAEDTVTVTGDSVNVRSEPNTDCEILGSLSRGQSLARTGYNNDGWIRIDYDGEEAYVSADYVE